MKNIVMPKTNAKLEAMSAQEVFDTVAKHLLTQNERAADNAYCRYRLQPEESDKVLMCAAGCLIEPDEYTTEIETKSWKAIADEETITSKHCNLIRQLQCIHDTIDPDEWRDALRQEAIDNKLDATVLHEP